MAADLGLVVDAQRRYITAAMSVQHHRPVGVLATGQTWCANGLPDHTIVEVFAQTNTTDAAIRVYMPHPMDRTVVMSVRSMRTWISRHKATKKEPTL
jgi:hypothetical protein